MVQGSSATLHVATHGEHPKNRIRRVQGQLRKQRSTCDDEADLSRPTRAARFVFGKGTESVRDTAKTFEERRRTLHSRPRSMGPAASGGFNDAHELRARQNCFFDADKTRVIAAKVSNLAMLCGVYFRSHAFLVQTYQGRVTFCPKCNDALEGR